MVGDLPTMPLTSIVWDGIMAYPALLAVNYLALASCSRAIKSVIITSPSWSRDVYYIINDCAGWQFGNAN